MMITGLTEENISKVVDNLDRRSMRYIAMLGMTLDDVKNHYRKYIGDSLSVCFCEDGIPFSLMSVGAKNNGTLDYLHIGNAGQSKETKRAITRFFRRLVRKAQNSGVTIEFRAIIDKEDEFIDTWYKALGYIVKEEDGIIKTYSSRG